MGILVYLIVLAVSGLIIGALARLALPGPDPMGIGTTILIGVVGSFVGGLVMLAITGGRNAGGIVVSVACATLIVYVIGLGPPRR
jgi:uncharacterized membrane protein YeaQ/YmgE (transglycosylase-associated protein family)